MNKVILIGNLTRDPEFNIINGDRPLCKMGLAVQRPFSKDQTVDFFNLTVWGKQAETCNTYLKKGSKIGVVGSIQLRNYEGNDGVKKLAVDIVVNEVEFLSSKSDSEYQKSSPSKFQEDDGLIEVPIIDGDLPF